MDDKALKKTLSEVVSKISNNSNISSDLQKDVKLLVELVNTIDQRVADISMKVDQFLNAGAKKPNAVPKKTPSTEKPVKKTPVKKSLSKKNLTDDEKDDAKENESNSTEITPIGQIKNILSYFKTRYGEDPECFNDHMEENQAKALFSENEDSISTKKEGDVRSKFKATLLYKNLTKSQKDKIREMMTSEKEQADADNSNDLVPDCGNDSD
jgi:hypothetical protein